MKRDEVVALLRRTFKGGIMRRLPKKRTDADVLMALSLVGMDPEGIFDESDINLHLAVWLSGIGSEEGVGDYVTLRRYLVDHGFLRRSSDGEIYRIRPERIAEVIEPDAHTIDPKQIFAEVEAERLARRKVFGGS